jgi:putative DNA primase/helicase
VTVHRLDGPRRGSTRRPSPALLPSPKVPLDVAMKLIEGTYRHPGGALLLRHWRGSFWSWTGSHWTELEDNAVRATVYKFTEYAHFLDDKDRAQPWAPTRHKVADLLDALRAVTHLPEAVHPPAWIDGGDGPPPHEVVACTNGLLHVTTRTLAEHDPRYFNLVAVPFAYDDQADVPVRWLAFLDELWPHDPDAITALREFFGYVISGRTDLHKILLLIGPTRAGKGVIARVLKGLVGEGNAAGPTLASLGTNFGLAPLIGKPLAIVSDARLGAANVHQIVERLLSISGEDMLTIDRKYREPWTGTVPARFVVISNELPRFGDASGAIANRFIVLTLGTSWLGRENPALTRELLVELPGILRWALDGLALLTAADRFVEPKSSADAVLALADIASPVSAFVRDRCLVGGEHDVAVADLFAAWRSWCEDNGRDKPGTVQILGRDLRAVVPALRTIRPRDGQDRERRYAGIALRSAVPSHNHNGSDRGPSRTNGPVHDGPQSTPLSFPVDNGVSGPCTFCGTSTGWADRVCSRCRLDVAAESST